MKKLTFISFMVLAFVLGSCSKDDDEKSLEGTVWEGSVTYGINKDVSTLSFKATTFDLTNSWEYDNDEDGVIDEKGSESDSGTYTYNHPNVVLTIDGETLSLTVNGDTMTWSDPESGVSINFKKK